MKTILKFLAIFLVLNGLTQFPGKAQTMQRTVAVHPVRLGIKGGVNFSTLYARDVDKTKAITGFNVGVYGKLPIAGMVSIQPELYFTSKGADVTYNNPFAIGQVRYTFNYLELPLLLVVNMTPNFNVHAGPFASFLINGKVKHLSAVSLFDFERNLDTSDYNRLETGIALGLGIDIASISIGMRYLFGLSTIGKERSFLDANYTFPDAKNGVLNFYLSLSLN
jgi:hypothetical protein